MNDKRVATNLIWKLLERFSVQMVQFVLQILLARLLSPQHYGELSIMVVFTNLATVFIQAGLNVSLIQNKDVEEKDFSSVFWVTFSIASAIYGILFFAIPFIADFYETPSMVFPFRILALMLLPGAFNAIQLAKASREMNFRCIFISNIVSVILSGCTAIVIAFFGGGIWALVVMDLLHIVLTCLVMLVAIKWYPKMVFERSRVKILFAYGWKLMVAYLINSLYQDLRSLVIAKKYSSTTLGYYNRGNQFPRFIISAVSTSVQSVLLPAMSKEQSDTKQLKALLGKSVNLSTYIVSPIIAGLVAVAPSLVMILLGDEWMPCVPYLRICSVAFVFQPIGACILSTINAVGRSDMFLKLEFIKEIIGITVLVIAVLCFNSPLAIAISFAVSMALELLVSVWFAKKLIGYSYNEQAMDVLPSFAVSMVMGCVVCLIGLLNLNVWFTLLLQIVVGVLLYIALSILLHLKSFSYLLSTIRSFLERGKKPIENKT